MGTNYTIETADFNDFTVPYATSDPNNWTRNETATFTFEFPTFHSDLTITEDATLGGVNGYDVVTVEDGATLTIPDGALIQAEQVTGGGTVTGAGSINIVPGISGALDDYAEWAGSWATLEMINSVLKYRTQIPDDAGISSLVWGIKPEQSLQDRNVVGVWGLVESIQNERNQALNINRYAVDVTVLAPIDDYADIDAVETDLVI